MKKDLVHSFSEGFIFNQAVEGMLLVDTGGKITRINPSCLKIFGYDHPDELLGKEVEVLIPAASRSTRQGLSQILLPYTASQGNGNQPET